MKLFTFGIVFVTLLAYVIADVSHLFNRGNVTPYKGPLPGDLPQNQPRQVYPQQQQGRISNSIGSGNYQSGQYYPKYQQTGRYQGYSG